MQWLTISIALSIVLTVVLNVALRLFPGASEEIGRRISELTMSRDGADDGQTRVIVPWKAMLIASILLTVAVNLLLWIV